ncbi:PREDICTED: uncharacterized protein LOC105450266 isoform X2 [Wasmannia auropunctata]|uniref:uncharacterized protein LOC105450266 isoform X2 n=1 Tax=Wasmannia auropunctata TaxID=64793 RepID=UPI0005F05ABE|nr:PREDICTED: uncharacterized protein LOC105450266 isoform X2 [Wasmannia auropunctata]
MAMNNDALIAIINDFVDSSDDQSDSESDDELSINANKVICGKRPRLQHYLNIIVLYDDQEFKSNFRFGTDYGDTCIRKALIRCVHYRQQVTPVCKMLPKYA